MFRPLSTLCGLALALPLFAQNAEPEIILHQEGLQIDVQPMGVVCEFQVPAEVRSTTPPVPFRIAPGAQVVERVPGDYAPGQPYAELRCSHAP